LPALPHINVVGSTITGTHGSGINHKSFANKVIAFDFVSADGTLRTLTLDSTPNFKNHILTFGGLGVITSMTMILVPYFMVQKQVYVNVDWDAIMNKDNLDKLMKESDFLSCFT